jgi:hypothetical protein
LFVRVVDSLCADPVHNPLHFTVLAKCVVPNPGEQARNENPRAQTQRRSQRTGADDFSDVTTHVTFKTTQKSETPYSEGVALAE